MRPIILLLMLALSPAAFAGSVGFHNSGASGPCPIIIGNRVCRLGNFQSGSISTSLTAPFSIDVVGSMNTIDITLEDLTCITRSICTFRDISGKVIHHGLVLFDFTGLVTFGQLVRIDGVAQLIATSTVADFAFSLDVASRRGQLTSGDGFASFRAFNVPEPGAFTLLLLGMPGLLLAGLVRRKNNPCI
jgi:hypothetical protein